MVSTVSSHESKKQSKLLAAANEALDTLLTQRPDIARLPQEELAVWWQPDMVEQLIIGLRKAGLEQVKVSAVAKETNEPHFETLLASGIKPLK